MRLVSAFQQRGEVVAVTGDVDQGAGLGRELVYDAFLQLAAISDRVGARALLIEAESVRAASFYRRLDHAFDELPGDPLKIVLLVKDVRAAIRKAAQSRMTGG